jgi:hypothetical protein
MLSWSGHKNDDVGTFARVVRAGMMSRSQKFCFCIMIGFPIFWVINNWKASNLELRCQINPTWEISQGCVCFHSGGSCLVEHFYRFLFKSCRYPRGCSSPDQAERAMTRPPHLPSWLRRETSVLKWAISLIPLVQKVPLSTRQSGWIRTFAISNTAVANRLKQCFLWNCHIVRFPSFILFTK